LLKTKNSPQIVSIPHTPSTNRNTGIVSMIPQVVDDSMMKKMQEEGELLEKAVKNKDISLCKKIDTKMQKDMCFSSVIFVLQKEAKNDSICSELTDTLSKSMCQNEINTRI
jgi:hypothetical protein